MYIPPTTLSGSRRMLNVSSLARKQSRSDWSLFLIIFLCVACLMALVIVAEASIGATLLLAGLMIILLLALIIRWPIVGLIAVTTCAVLVEQSPLPYHVITDQLNVFYWPTSLAGQPERPFGYLVLFVFFVIICHNLLKRRKVLMGGKLLLPLLLFLSCVVVGIVHGFTSGGLFKIITAEIRPLWYLFLSYLLAYNLVTRFSHVRAFFWTVIVGAGVKAAQGTYIYLIVLHGSLTGVHQIMAHEESFFFIGLLLLVVLFCIHHRYRPQFYVALLLVPIVTIALVANQRRTDYLAFLAGVAIACVLTFCVKPQARKALTIGMLLTVILVGGYVALFYNTPGAFAEPARGIVSVFNANEQDPDGASNLYRQEEIQDLKYTVKQSPWIGYGFGKQFLEPILLPTLATDDPTFGGNPFRFVPHNTIYWIWMRLGNIGFFALWYLFGVLIIRGCLIVRQLQNRYLQLVAIYVVAIILIEVFVAYSDYQLYFYRNIIYIGLLSGILFKLPALDREKQEKKGHINEDPDRVSVPTVANMGSKGT